ncbi:MAG: PAS domain S-box protein [Flavobacteriales bacterium]|nr:PAS domain S-box protein [Flavobacteriales bacterium]
MLNSTGGTFAQSDTARVCELLFMTATEGLVVVDADGRIMMRNPSLVRMFGYEAHELLGRGIEELLPDSLRAKHAAHRAAYDRKPMQRSMGMGMELKGQRKDGSVFPVEVSLNHFDVDGKRYVMALVSDITLRRLAEDELVRTNAELEDRVEQRTAELKAAQEGLKGALEKERELHALKSRFVSMASHEFRTPLSTIMGSNDLIGRYASDNEKVDKHVKRIRSKVRELTAMLNEFLSLERIEQGIVQVQPAEIDVVHQCIEQIEELRGLAKPGQRIDYDHEGSERMVTTDPQMLGHVITNLVSNAVKYSPAGTPVVLRTRITDGLLTITITDHGVGIPAEDQQHLFERFFRGSNVVTIQGTGLGLNIVRRYLDLLGGSITFSSRPGETIFSVALPQRIIEKN